MSYFRYNLPRSVTIGPRAHALLERPSIPIKPISPPMGYFVDAAGVRVTTGNEALDRLVKWGFWIGLGVFAVKAYGVLVHDEPFFEPGIPPAWKANPWYWARRDKDRLIQMVRYLCAHGLSVEHIEKQLGISVDTAIEWMKEEGLYEEYASCLIKQIRHHDVSFPIKEESGEGVTPQKVSYQDAKQHTRISPEDAEIMARRKLDEARESEFHSAWLRARMMYKPGGPVDKIAQELGVSKRNVIRWLKEDGLYRSARSPSAIQKERMRKKILDAYEPRGNVADIARKLGITEEKVLRILRQEGRYDPAPKRGVITMELFHGSNDPVSQKYLEMYKLGMSKRESASWVRGDLDIEYPQSEEYYDKYGPEELSKELDVPVVVSKRMIEKNRRKT